MKIILPYQVLYYPVLTMAMLSPSSLSTPTLLKKKNDLILNAKYNQTGSN